MRSPPWPHAHALLLPTSRRPKAPTAGSTRRAAADSPSAILTAPGSAGRSPATPRHHGSAIGTPRHGFAVGRSRSAVEPPAPPLSIHHRLPGIRCRAPPTLPRLEAPAAVLPCFAVVVRWAPHPDDSFRPTTASARPCVVWREKTQFFLPTSLEPEMAAVITSSVGGCCRQILVEAHGSTRTLILNRPKQLNALTSTMINGLLRCFTAYEKDDAVKLLIMKGKGRAFCSGGDVTGTIRSIHNESWKWGADFFRNMYSLNYIIATYTKPQVSLIAGIVMGGGAGVSLHGRFRVVTDNTVFAMPETALGLFTDVGASYFLSRLPGFYGEYVALSGVRLDSAEMLACGLATHFVQSDRLQLLEESLKKVDTSNASTVCSTIEGFAQQPPLKGNSSLNRLEIINKCFSKSTVEEIISTLEQVASNLADEWVATTIQCLKRASPTSLKISLRSIREGRTQTVGECLHREYRIVCHVLQGDLSRDFYEGTRAILIDRDQNPMWMPPRLEEVHDKVVEEYFSRIHDPQWEDLKLPARGSYGRIIEPRL